MPKGIRITNEQKDSVLRYFESNPKSSLRQCERELLITKSTISKILKENNLGHLISKQERIIYTTAGDIICNRCGYEGKPKEFTHSGSKHGPLGHCYNCYKERINNWSNDSIEAFLSYRLTNLRNENKTKKKKPFSLTKEYLIDLYNKQNGLCFYSGINMTTIRGEGFQRNQLSIDRIIPDKGYVEGNIVLCSRRINVIKNDLTLKELENWIPKWYEKIKKKLEEENHSDWLKGCAE
jgi:hypothetical protein